MFRFRAASILLALLLSLTVQRAVAVVPHDKPADTFLEVEAKTNDNVTTLLRRYGLYDYECNVTQFFKINGLKEDYRLRAGQTYKIPVLEVTYNGKSIRSTLGIDDWKQAVRIQNYNLDAVKKQLRTDNFIESKTLWVPWHELHCSDDAPAADPPAPADMAGEPVSAANTRSFPIFGPKYERTPLTSSRLKDHIYYIISGHGGPDVGAQGVRAGNTLCEDEYAYDVCLRLARLLVAHGATVYMIVRDPDDGIRDENYLKCDKDEYVWGDHVIPLDQKARLAQRTDLVNSLYEQHLKAGHKNQTLVEIHVDSRTRNQRTDVFFYHRPGSTTSMELAQKVQRVFLAKYLKIRGTDRYTGSVSARNLYTLKETTIPRAVYIELANIRNDYDQQRLVITSNRQAIANWIGEALMAK